MNTNLMYSILSKEFNNVDLRYSVYSRCKELVIREYEIRKVTHNLLVVSSAIIEDTYQCHLPSHDDSYTIPKDILIRMFLTGDTIPVGDKYVSVVHTKNDNVNTVSLQFKKIEDSFIESEEHKRLLEIASINNHYIDKISVAAKQFVGHPIAKLFIDCQQVKNGFAKIDDEVFYTYYYKGLPVILPCGEYKGDL